MNIQNLVEKYQPYLYNLAIRLTYCPDKAEDLTQDVWLKIFENIDNFKENSNFTTWAYRIMINHFLNQKRQYAQLTFENFENTMESMRDEELSNEYDELEKQLLINEAKVGRMLGMLLCLEKEQRAIFIIGDIFEIQSNIACTIFDITQENFRKKLSRVRKELYGFMNNFCGEANRDNSCRCKFKTKAFMDDGYVDEHNITFNNEKKVKDVLQTKCDMLDNTMESMYKNLYQNHPFVAIEEKEFAKNILKNRKIKKIFEL